MTCIMRGDTVVSRSRNLRGVLRYASRERTFVRRASIRRLPGTDPRGVLYVEWDDGAHVEVTFADFGVLANWLNSRHSWRGVRWFEGMTSPF